LTTGEIYRFKVLAVNVVGSSQLSEASADMIAALLPGQAGQPVYITSHESLVAFKWTPPEDDGGSDLTGYKIAWCAQIDSQGNFGNFVDLIEISRPQT